MKKTTIFFLRHGEVYNPRKILYGRLPSFSLSRDGIKKIENSANFFKNQDINFIYSSPQLRARESAQIIGKTIGLKPKISFLINEVRLFCQGISLKNYKNQIQRRLYSSEFVKIGQESIESIATRMTKFLELIKHRHKGRKILAVSHGDPIIILKSVLENVPFTWEYKKANYLNTGDWIKIVC